MDVIHLPHVEGATEPYIADLLAALVVASDAKTVLETGGFQGHTSVVLAQALRTLGGERNLIVAEIDQDRATAIDTALYDTVAHSISWKVYADDVMTVIRGQPDESLDLVFLDDDHTQDHVRAEVEALWPKMRPNGLLTFHDVYGVCDLQAVVTSFGGYALDLPRWGPAGGLGIIQVR
jgi:predicted O-methyltransferase YrrM